MTETTSRYDETLALLAERRRGLSRREFLQLAELGAFDHERVELVHGQIVALEPAGPDHASPIDLLMEVLVLALAGRARVRVQNPYASSEVSQPQPDIAVVPLGNYGGDHPARALLAIEVSVSSLAYDLRVKAPLYAASNVLDYWVIDVRRRRALVHRRPEKGRYTELTEHGADAVITPLAFPDVEVRLADVIG